jgi:serine/threonine-protein kinase SRPK3
VFDESDSSEDEGLPDYRIGGYHPVHVGEVFLDRYIIVQKLGWGHFSTVWLTKDLKHDTFVALKVQKSSQNYLEAAYDEVEILDVVSQKWKTDEWQNSLGRYYKNLNEEKKKRTSYTDCYCIQLLNSFLHYGPNGKHFVMVFEILGVNLLEIIKRYDYKGVPIPLVRTMAKQCLIGLDYLHRMCNIVHTDLKPENVLICLTEEEVAQIATENRLKQNKNEHKHLKRDRNIAELALGASFKNLITGEKPISTTMKEDRAHSGELYPIDPLEPISYSNCEGFSPLTYAELLPEYTTAIKNKKKKLRTKHQKELEEINIKKFDEFKQQKIASQSHPEIKEEDEAKEHEDSKEDIKAEVIGKKDKLEGDMQIDLTSPDEQTPQERTGSKGPKIDEKVRLKICDLGNGCWTHHHFSSEIQTRQYRSPETIIGLTYGTSADIWSFACMIFEMITGDFLFEPRKGHNFDKDDDHLAQMMEILGKMPKNIAFSGRLSKRFFDKTGHLLKIRGLQHWPLKKVLMEKYRFIESEAESLADFLLPMLEWYPEKRATAKKMLDHPWLEMESNYDYLLSERDYQVMMLKNRLTNEPPGEDNKEMSELGESDNDLFNADSEDNNSTMSDEDADDEFFSISGTRTIARKNHFSEDEEIDTRLPGPNYLNNSFTGPYPEDMNRDYLDKGPNQQFSDIDED